MTEDNIGVDMGHFRVSVITSDARVGPALSHLAWTLHLYLPSFTFKVTSELLKWPEVPEWCVYACLCRAGFLYALEKTTASLVWALLQELSPRPVLASALSGTPGGMSVARPVCGLRIHLGCSWKQSGFCQLGLN